MVALLLSDFVFAVAVMVTVQGPSDALAVKTVVAAFAGVKVPHPSGDAVHKYVMGLVSGSTAVDVRVGVSPAWTEAGVTSEVTTGAWSGPPTGPVTSRTLIDTLKVSPLVTVAVALPVPTKVGPAKACTLIVWVTAGTTMLEVKRDGLAGSCVRSCVMFAGEIVTLTRVALSESVSTSRTTPPCGCAPQASSVAKEARKNVRVM